MIFWLLLTAFLTLCPPAHAAQDLTSVTIDLAPAEVLIGIVLVALLALFGFRKFIRFANRT